jgi:hypothetical protein
MLKRILPFLNKSLPIDLALKGLGKVDPKFAKMISLASGAGYTGNQILDFLRKEAGMGKTQQNSQIDPRLSPEEAASVARARQPDTVGQGLKTLGKAGLTAASLYGGSLGLGAALAGQAVSPDEILGPEKEAKQIPYRGQNQIPYDPYDRRPPVPKSGDPLIPGGPQKQGSPPVVEEAQEEGPVNVIGQYSDELRAFLENQMSKFGRSPREAAAVANLEPKLKKVMTSLEKALGKPFSQIVEEIYGSASQPQSQGAKQSGAGQAALMEVLQKLQQMRSR